MEPKDVMKQILEFNKNTFDNIYSSTLILQEQSRAMAQNIIDSQPGMPEETKKFLYDWLDSVKKAQSEFKKAIDENISKFEAMFTNS
ncbi:MAG: hypothetical protein CSA22_00425 [Deltaproteobacteria bacterium]|nr:MAG: hypothetical protein CSA22_00425 [Deltaproteobacteria bacterium]